MPFRGDLLYHSESGSKKARLLAKPSSSLTARRTGERSVLRDVAQGGTPLTPPTTTDTPAHVGIDSSQVRPDTMKKSLKFSPPSAERTTESDDILVGRAINRDKDAYRQLVERYQTKIFALAFDVLRSREDAEDVVQETFVKAYLSLPSFKGQSSFYTWLYRIAYNMSIDIKRRVSRRGGVHVEFKEAGSVSGGDDAQSGPTAVPEHVQTIEGPAEALYRKQTGSRIRAVLNELSPEHRAVVVLREVDGLNYEEISEATGIPKGTVMSRLHYARKALQNALRDLSPGHRASGNQGTHEGGVAAPEAGLKQES